MESRVKIIIATGVVIFLIILFLGSLNTKRDHEEWISYDSWKSGSSSVTDSDTPSKKIYKLCYDFVYEKAIEAGKEEKEKGYNYEPEIVLAQPLFQGIFKSYIDDVVKKFGEQYRKDAEQGMKDGFFAGYKEGYNNR